MTASVLKKDPKHTSDERNTFRLDKTRQNVQIFEEVLFFKVRTTKKQKNKQLIQLLLCQLDVGGWWKEKGTRLTQSHALDI